MTYQGGFPADCNGKSPHISLTSPQNGEIDTAYVQSWVLYVKEAKYHAKGHNYSCQADQLLVQGYNIVSFFLRWNDSLSWELWVKQDIIAWAFHMGDVHRNIASRKNS